MFSTCERVLAPDSDLDGDALQILAIDYCCALELNSDCSGLGSELSLSSAFGRGRSFMSRFGLETPAAHTRS